MIPEEIQKRVLLLNEAGRGIRWIARHAKLSRNTVRKILRPNPPPKEAGEGKTNLLDERYKRKIDEILKEDDLQREKRPSQKPLTSKKVFKEIRKLGYQGGRTLVYDYVRKVRGPSRRSRKASCRFETSPATESQQDWSPYRVLIGGKEVRIQLFSLILCWSRYQFLFAYLDQKLPTLLWGHVAAFEHFLGVPWKILYDRQASITPGEVDGKPILNDTFADFAEHYGFEVALCARGDPQRKGKVEKPFLAFETDFLPRRTFESIEDLNRQIRQWLDGEEDPEEGNHRKHGTTGERPCERWLEEREYLFELPAARFLPRRVEPRGVNHDCTVSVGGCLYTVPAELVEKGQQSVWVSVGPEDLLIYNRKGELVAQHQIERGPGKLVIDETHYESIRRRRKATSRPELERQFLERFPQSLDFLEGLKRTVRSIAPIHLRELMALTRRYGREAVEAALQEALSHGTTTVGYVRQLLGRKHPTAHLGALPTEPPRGLSLGPVDPGSTEGYQDIFNHPEERKENDDQDSDS